MDSLSLIGTVLGLVATLAVYGLIKRRGKGSEGGSGIGGLFLVWGIIGVAVSIYWIVNVYLKSQ